MVLDKAKQLDQNEMTHKQRLIIDDEFNREMFSIFRPRFNLYSDREFFPYFYQRTSNSNFEFPTSPSPLNFNVKNSKAS